MKTRVFSFILLMIMAFTAIYASEDPTEQAEYFRKKQELDLLADRFKAETGFEGTIEYNYSTMKLSSFTGTFRDISMEAVRDSVAFRHSSNRVITKLLPYIEAKSNQLMHGIISIENDRIRTRYLQVVNGYPVESGGYLNIYYKPSQNRIGILNTTVDILQEPLGSIISRSQAIDIVINTHRVKYHITDRELVPYEVVDIKYSTVGSAVYKLMYLVTLDDITYYIDAMTGDVMGDISYVDYTASSVLVQGKVYDPNITSLSPSVLSESLALQGIEVWFNGNNGYTNADGMITFPDTTLTSYSVKMKHESFRICDFSDSLSTLESTEYTCTNHFYETLIGDSCAVNGVGKLCHAPNIFTHADAQIAYLKNLNPSYSTNMHIITNCVFSNPNIGGQISYTSNRIRLKTGLIPNYVTHEFGHHFVWNALSSTFAPQTQEKAMDESFAHYLSCISVPWSKLIYPNGLSTLLYDLSLPLPIEIWAGNLGVITENKYSHYLVGLNISSAWWSLRNNSIFGSDPRPGVKAFDKILVDVLKDHVNTNETLRYKPRYFFNLLMQEVADIGQTTELNSKQEALNDAYNSRGLHFYPKVESISAVNSSRNIFGLNEPVHVKISDCPQNTRINIYVIKHGDYNYTDGAPVSALSNFYASGFTPITTVATGPSGEWDGLIWTTPSVAADAVGDYDIIVDIGSPSTPDGIIHFNFSGANVMDGFDGRLQPGFTVKDDGIDVVMAIDITGSLSETYIRNQVLKTGRILVGQLRNGDRVSVFGFGLGYNGNTPYDLIRNMIPNEPNNNQLQLVNNNLASLCDNTHITLPANFPDYWTSMITPFNYAYSRFTPPARSRGFVLISDGWHSPDEDDNVTPYSPNTSIHNLINNHYLPDIGCYAMRYMIPIPEDNNQNYIPYDNINAGLLMSNIAAWGNGLAFHQDSAYSSFLNINTILDDIRNSNSTEDKKGSFTQDSLVVIPFSVDTVAHSLQVNLSVDNFVTTDPINFSLMSPSGIECGNGTDYYNYYTSLGRVDIPYPEEGVWTATFERAPNSTYVNQYSFTAKVESDLQINIPETPVAQAIDLPFHVSVDVKDYLTPVPDAQVTITATRDNWSWTKNLYDDGYHSDGLANDGVYGNSVYFYSEGMLAFSNVAGSYDLRFEIIIPSHLAKRVKTSKIEMLAPDVFPLASEGRKLKLGWNWVGFPRLIRETGGNLIDYATISLEPHLSTVLSESDYAAYEDHWLYYGLQYLDSKEGYKLRIKDVDTINLFEMGTLVDTTSVYTIRVGWNWLTYPCYTTVYPEEALAGIWDNIDYIRAQKWSMKKEHGVWVHDSFSLRPIIKYGDSIEVRAISDAPLIWNSDRPREGSKPLEAQHYIFEDKPNYETIMVESIEGNPSYEEIGIYQGETCIGARVFEGYPIQILAYSEPAVNDSTALEFRIWAGDKREIVLKPTSVYGDRVLSQGSQLYPELGAFRHVHLKQNGETIAAVFALEGNYPNPFNPSTTIAFSIPDKAKTKITVYNLKGQKVKVLINSELLKGQHKVIWDGRDSNNRSVSSGIYFFKLDSGGKSSIRKAMLMK